MTGELFEYWIKVVLKLRMAETKTPHTPQNFNFYSKKAIDNYRLFGVEAALKYINEHLPTFNYIQQENITNVDYTILESLICARAEYFIGTELSFYSINIIGERSNMGKINNNEIRIPGRGIQTYSRKLTKIL